MEPIEVQSLSKDYGHGRGVFHVSLSVHEGEVFGFLGPNGAGKSTTIRHLMGFSKPDEGQALLFGRKVFENYADVMNRVGYLPGEIALPAGLTGWDFIDMMKKLRGTDCDENTQRLMRMFDLDPSGETKRMSLGVKRKLAVVTAFMHDPDVLILDEPTSGLDYRECMTVMQTVREMADAGSAVVMVCHDMEVVSDFADRAAVMADGRIIGCGTLDEVFANAALMERAYVAPPQVAALSARLAQGVSPAFANISEVAELVETVRRLAAERAGGPAAGGAGSAAGPDAGGASAAASLAAAPAGTAGPAVEKHAQEDADA